MRWAALSGGLRSVLLAAATAARADGADPNGLDDAAERTATRNWSAAVGFVASIGPEYAGSQSTASSLEPGLGLRWGRLSLASRGAFAVRGSDQGAQGGLRVELAQGDRLRAGLGLRAYSGRSEASSIRLAGMGDVQRTVRARLSASYRLDDGWRLASAVMVDASKRGYGTVFELGIRREQRLTDRTLMSIGATLSGGDRDFMQTYFGVTPEQAQRSGYSVYQPAAGLGSMGVLLGVSTQLTPRWAVFYGTGVSRLVDVAARSPLTFEPNGWGLSAGTVYRF
jgi:outer membrane scaffolding protein for murein synthesis (MipA/OmpV family)